MSRRHLLEFDGDPETGKGGGSWRWRHRNERLLFLPKHRDPFERLIISQAVFEQMQAISNYPDFDAYPVQRIW
jgi:hypothetical protein